MADPIDPLYDPRGYFAYYLQQAGRTPSPKMAEALKPQPRQEPWMRSYLSPEMAMFLSQAIQYGPMALPAGARPPSMRGSLTFRGKTYPTSDAMMRAMEDAGAIPRAPDPSIGRALEGVNRELAPMGSARNQLGPPPEQGPWAREWDHRAWQDRHPSPYEELARHRRTPRLTEHEVRQILGGAFERE